jgi:hypothetical protein
MRFDPTTDQRGGARRGPGAPPWRGATALALAGLCALAAGCAVSAPPARPERAFCFERDTFAFANETVWDYADGAGRSAGATDAPAAERYTRRCFVLACSAVQFWKFARFEPDAEPLPAAELARRIRRVRAVAAWRDALPADEKIVLSGYPDLRSFSERQGRLLRQHLGPGWTTYFDPRKFSMPFVPSRAHQERTHELIHHWVSEGHPLVLWLYNFPRVNLNHAVTVFAADEPVNADGTRVYLLYDPNYTDRPRTLTWDPRERRFYFEPTFYFPGGPVNVRAIYRGPVQ